MKFCEKCGNLMIAEKTEKGLRYVCRICGHISHKKVTLTKISEKIRAEEKIIPIMKEEEAFSQYPKTKIICPKCENNEAYWFIQQTRSGDEPPTRFYCCSRCRYKWREY